MRAPAGVAIRDIALGDIDRLLAYINALIAEDTFIDLHGAPLLRSDEEVYVRHRLGEITRGEGVMRVAATDDRIVGASELRRLVGRRTHVAEVGLSVAADHRDRGLGTALLEDLRAQATRLGVRRLVLRVFATNERARHVYRRCGYVEVGRIPGMVQHRGADVDEVWMTREV